MPNAAEISAKLDKFRTNRADEAVRFTCARQSDAPRASLRTHKSACGSKTLNAPCTQEIFESLASVDDINGVVLSIDTGKLFGAWARSYGTAPGAHTSASGHTARTHDRKLGPSWRSALLELLCVDRAPELGAAAKAHVLRGVLRAGVWMPVDHSAARRILMSVTKEQVVQASTNAARCAGMQIKCTRARPDR